MVQHLSLSRPVLAAAIAALAWSGAADAASHRHGRQPRHTAASAPAATAPRRAAASCTAPLSAGQHDPSVRDVTLQRAPDGGGVVTMCLVSRQAALINPSASIGIFGKDGILAGTAAQAMPGKFQPNFGPTGELQTGTSVNVVRFTLQVPADPPLPSRLNPTAMIQLAWDSCPDDRCAKPAEQSLALLQTMRISGGDKPDATPADTAPTDAAPRAVVTAAAHGEKPAKAHRRKHHSTASVASGTIY